MKIEGAFFNCSLLALMLLFCASARSQDAELVDQRDGKTYSTVKIGCQLWMARNLDYGLCADTFEDQQGDVIKYCYNHETAHCEKYGGLYTWKTAKEVCPSGWHLPTVDDWEELSEFLGVTEAGQKLKATSKDVIPWDGTNESGFNAIPSGGGNGIQFNRLGQWAMYWAADESDSQRAWSVQLDGFWYPNPPKYKRMLIVPYYLKTNLMSVRCIKNEAP